jgi:hypothetical protein
MMGSHRRQAGFERGLDGGQTLKYSIGRRIVYNYVWSKTWSSAAKFFESRVDVYNECKGLPEGNYYPRIGT